MYPGRALGGGLCSTARTSVAGSPASPIARYGDLMVLAHRPPAELDAFLVRRAQAGDRDAFATLMEEYGDVVSRLVRHFVQDGDDARDVEQDTWIRAATHIDSLRDESRFRPWLKSIARTTSLNFLSSRKRRRERVSTFEECGSEDFEDQDAPTPERALMSQESQRKVWLVLGSLSERDRTALYLREYQDQPYEVIAERLGISRNAAEVCVFRARERFRKIFAQVESFAPTCGVDGLRLSMLLDGEASAGRADLERHVAGCDCCRERLQTMAAGQALYRNLGVLGFPLLPGAGLAGWLGALFAKVAALFGGGSEAAAGGGAAASATGGAVAVGATGAGATATGVAASAGATGVAAASGAAVAVGAGVTMGGVGLVATATAAVVVTVSAVVAPVALPQARAATPSATRAASVVPQAAGMGAAGVPHLAAAVTESDPGKPVVAPVPHEAVPPAPVLPVPAAIADPVVPVALVAAAPAPAPSATTTAATPMSAPATTSTASAPPPTEAATVAASQESGGISSTSADASTTSSATAAATEEKAKTSSKGGKPEHATKDEDRSDKGGKPETAGPKSEEKGGKPDHAVKDDEKADKGSKPEAAAPKSEDKGGKPETAGPKSDDKGGKPESAGPKPDDRGGKADSAGPKSEDKGGKGKGKNA